MIHHMALRSGTSTISRRYRTRRLASCIRLPSRRAPRLCANSCIGYRSDNGSRTRRSIVGPRCIFENSFETIRLPEHFDLLPLHYFTDHLCPSSSPLGHSTILHLKSWNCLGTSTRSANTFSSFRRCLKSGLFAAAYDTQASYYPPTPLLIRLATWCYTNFSSIV